MSRHLSRREVAVIENMNSGVYLETLPRSLAERLSQRPLVINSLFWISLAAVALSLRLPNLGKLGFWGDELYTVISVEAILEHGYPLLPSGGIYLRYLPWLYIDALFAWLFGLSEFSLRLPFMLANLASIGMSYLLAKRLFGKTIGLITVVLLVFSGWEIEFSRHARMYAAFQFLYITGLYVFYRGFIDGSRIARWLTIPVWTLALWTHELGAVLSVCFFIPLFVRSYSRTRPWMLASAFVVFGFIGLIYAYLVRVARFGTSLSAIQEGSQSARIDKLAAIPLDLPLRALQTSELFIAGVSVMVFVGFLAIVGWDRHAHSRRWQYYYLIPIMVVCLLGQLGLAALLLLLYTIVFFRGLQDWREGPFLTGVGLIAASGAAWTLFGWSEGFTVKKSFRLLFEYPYVYERFGKFFLTDWPIESGLATLGAVIVWRKFIETRDSAAGFVLASLVGALLFFGGIALGDDGARYSFHLYPVLLIVAAYAIANVAERVLPGQSQLVKIMGIVLCLLLIPSDTQIIHGVSIGQRNYGDAFARPYLASGKSFPVYPDYKTTSYFISERLKDEDIVITTKESTPLYYIPRVNYLWAERDNIPRRGIGVPTIVGNQLKTLAENNIGKRIWWLTDDMPGHRREMIGTELSNFLDEVAGCAVYIGKDRRTEVFLFSANDEGRPACGKAGKDRSTNESDS